MHGTNNRPWFWLTIYTRWEWHSSDIESCNKFTAMPNNNVTYERTNEDNNTVPYATKQVFPMRLCGYTMLTMWLNSMCSICTNKIKPIQSSCPVVRERVWCARGFHMKRSASVHRWSAWPRVIVHPFDRTAFGGLASGSGAGSSGDRTAWYQNDVKHK